MSKIEVNTVAPQCGTTLTLGESGDTVTLGSGASQSGFGRTGTVDWDTTAKTTSFTAVSGNGYFVNTTSGAITVTLPASPSAGDIVSISDYAGTAATNNITIARNGSNFEGGTSNGEITINRQAVTLIYVDATQGWVPTAESDSSFEQPLFITATGGTVTCCGNFKIHTFTGPGTFTVSCAGNAGGSNTVDYLVVAGGGGGAANASTGGGGGGGFRESSGTASGCYTASPLGACVSALPVTAQGYPIAVGGGGAGGTPGTPQDAGKGVNSSFSTITSTGGGGGSSESPVISPESPGGSGGGARYYQGAGGIGNTPPVSPPQGQPGGAGSPPGTTGNYPSGGGGGATEGGGDGGPGPSPSGRGGAGATTSISASSTAYAGGAGAGGYNPGGNLFGAASPCGTGGAGNGTAGTTNRGGGGGGTNCSATGGAGGSGIVIIRYKFQ